MDIEEFEEVRRWLNNVRVGTVSAYESRLRLFCE
jgi:hypothetical protein